MPYETPEMIHLPNPQHPESDFRKNNKGKLNVVGTVNFGNGVKGRLGLLKNSGKSAVAVYLFQKPKYTMATAKEWLEKHKSKGSDGMEMQKEFEFIMPLRKDFEGKDGFYYLEYGLSTTDVDLENDQMTEECIDDMIDQVTKLNSLYGHDPKQIIGPFTKAWKEENVMYVQVRVKPSMKASIKEDIDTGVRLGGSIGGNVIKGYQEGDIRKIEKVRLLEGSLTPLPINWSTLGTAREGIAKGNCKNNICKQILKTVTLQEREEQMPVNFVLVDEIAGELGDVLKAVTMLPGYPEDLDDFKAQDKAQLMSLLGSLVTALEQLIKDMVDEEVDWVMDYLYNVYPETLEALKTEKAELKE